MAIILPCGRRASELSNKAQSRACNIGYDPWNYSRVKTWIVIFLRVWMTFSFFISLVYLIRCFFLSLLYLFIFASFIVPPPSFSLFIFILLFFILFFVFTTSEGFRSFFIYLQFIFASVFSFCSLFVRPLMSAPQL